MYFWLLSLLSASVAEDPGTWTSINLESTLSFSGFNGTSLIIHNDLFYLFGGENANTFNENLTEFYPNGTLYASISCPSNLTARSHHTFTDVTTGAIIVGGKYLNSSTETALGDVWFYNYTSRTFTQKDSLPNDTLLYEHCACYDSSNDMIVLFGGYGSMNGSTYADHDNVYIATSGMTFSTYFLLLLHPLLFRYRLVFHPHHVLDNG